LATETPKYITIKLDEDADKIFGLDKVDKSKPILVVEGPLDSLFLDNCIAMAGADFNNFDGDLTIIFDNEPRNKEIIKRMYDVVEKDYNLVVWPEDMRHKDINDMIMAGLTKTEVYDILNRNTYSKLSALTKLNEYKKV